MSNNGRSDDDITPVPQTAIKNPDNRELVTFLGNLLLESRQHTIELKGLYEMFRELVTEAPPKLRHAVIDTQEKHISRVSDFLDDMKIALG